MQSMSRAQISITIAVVLCAGLVLAMAAPAAAARPDARPQRGAGDEVAESRRADHKPRKSKNAKAGESRARPQSSNASERARTAPNGPKEEHRPATASKAAAGDRPATAASDGPAGNKGSIKVRPVGTAAHPPRHYPHLPCEVQVDFYGFPHDSATLTARSHAPTSPTGQTLLTDTVTLAASSSNPPGNELVGSTTLDFTGVVDGLTYHEQQGYHVKLTAEIDGPQGANVKHKVFWIDCPPEAASAGGDEKPEPLSGELDGGDGATVTGSDDTLSEQVLAAGGVRSTRALAAVPANERPIGAVAAADTVDEQPLGPARTLAQTGIGAIALALLAMAGIGLGAALLRRRS